MKRRPKMIRVNVYDYWSQDKLLLTFLAGGSIAQAEEQTRLKSNKTTCLQRKRLSVDFIVAGDNHISSNIHITPYE